MIALVAKNVGRYFSHGYFDAQVERGTFEQREEKGRPIITPVIKIAERGKYSLIGVQVRGARNIAPDSEMNTSPGCKVTSAEPKAPRASTSMFMLTSSLASTERAQPTGGLT